MNLFIAIIIDAFFGQAGMLGMPVKEKSIADFVKIWSKYDRNAEGFITIQQLELFIIDLSNAREDEGAALI